VIPDVFQKLMPSAPDAVMPFEPTIVSPASAGAELINMTSTNAIGT